MKKLHCVMHKRYAPKCEICICKNFIPMAKARWEKIMGKKWVIAE